MDPKLAKKKNARTKTYYWHHPNSHVVMMHGAAPVSEHSDPESTISVAQQSAEVNVELASGVHPTPPHCPHASTQHASKLVASTPARPLLHTAPASTSHNGQKHTQREEKRQEEAEWVRTYKENRSMQSSNITGLPGLRTGF